MISEKEVIQAPVLLGGTWQSVAPTQLSAMWSSAMAWTSSKGYLSSISSSQWWDRAVAVEVSSCRWLTCGFTKWTQNTFGRMDWKNNRSIIKVFRSSRRLWPHSSWAIEQQRNIHSSTETRSQVRMETVQICSDALWGFTSRRSSTVFQYTHPNGGPLLLRCGIVL